jgi:CBS domain-containing protein
VRSIDASCTAQDAMRDYFGPQQAHRAFPVVDGERLVGIVDRSAVAAWAAESAGTPVGELCAGRPLHFAVLGESCRSVATRLARDRLERLPVVKDKDSLALAGLVARSDLIKPSVIHFEEEEKRERLLGLPWQSEP